MWHSKNALEGFSTSRCLYTSWPFELFLQLKLNGFSVEGHARTTTNLTEEKVIRNLSSFSTSNSS